MPDVIKSLLAFIGFGELIMHAVVPFDGGGEVVFEEVTAPQMKERFVTFS